MTTNFNTKREEMKQRFQRYVAVADTPPTTTRKSNLILRGPRVRAHFLLSSLPRRWESLRSPPDSPKPSKTNPRSRDPLLLLGVQLDLRMDTQITATPGWDESMIIHSKNGIFQHFVSFMGSKTESLVRKWSNNIYLALGHTPEKNYVKQTSFGIILYRKMP